MTTKSGSSTLFSLAGRLYRLYRPYFGLTTRNKKWRFLAAAIILINSMLAAYCMNIVNVSIYAFAEMLTTSTITYAACYATAGYFLAGLVACSLLNIINVRIGFWLAESLSTAINKKNLKRLYKNEVHYTMKIAQSDPTQQESLNPAQVMSHDNPRLNDKVLELTTNLLMITGNFLVGAIGLYAMSVPLSFTVASTAITIPAYLLLGTILFGVMYNAITNRIGYSLGTHLHEESKVQSDFHHEIHHVAQRGEVIAFRKGSQYELNHLLETVRENRNCQGSIANVRAGLTFLNSANDSFMNFFALMMALPSLLAGKMNMGKLYELVGNFQLVTQFFIWKSENFDKITECDVLLKNMETFQKRIAQAEALHERGKRDLIIQKEDNLKHIQVEGLSLTDIKGDFLAKNGVPILKNFNINIEKGKITRLKGKSGAGKTSFLRALAGLNPYARGKIRGMPGKTYFLPSEPYFPYKKTLLEAILYPRTTPATVSEREKIVQLMKDMGFEQSKINLLDTHADWYGNGLSDGERKRIMIVPAIMAEPELLFMDEATRGIDPATKRLVERTIKKYLPKTTIVYIDHDPIKDEKFNDCKIKLGAVV